MFIDIITQPGIRPLHRERPLRLLRQRARRRAIPSSRRRARRRSQNFSLNVGGTLLKERSSFSLGVSGTDSYRTPNLYAATPAGTRAENLNLRMPNDSLSVNGIARLRRSPRTRRCAWASMRSHSTSRNLGVGAYDLADRAYATDNANFILRVQEAGPLGRRFFINTRFMTNWSDTERKFGRRGADHRRARCVHRRRRAAGRRTPHADLLAAVRPRLRARHPLVAHGRLVRRRHVPDRRRLELPRDLHVREPRGLRGGPAAHLHAAASATRPSRTRTGRRRSTSRTTSASART